MAEKKTTAKKAEDKKPEAKKPTAAKKVVKAVAKTAAKPAPKPAPKPAEKVAKVKKATPKSPAAMIGLFQYFLPRQPATLADKAMTAIKAPDAVTPLTHAGFIKELLAHPQTRDMRVWGLLPADYPQRLAMSGAEIRVAIEAAPGFDAYLFNPHVEIESLYENLWVQGEVSHPKLMALCGDVFRQCGMDVSALTRLMPSALMVTGQAVVASADFWSAWLTYLAAFLQKADALPDKLKSVLYRGNADPKGRHINGTYLMFVIERLFNEFIASNTSSFKVQRIHSVKQEGKLNPYLRDLRQLREKALLADDAQLRSIWMGYRKLYLMVTNGKEWMESDGKILELLSSNAKREKGAS